MSHASNSGSALRLAGKHESDGEYAHALKILNIAYKTYKQAPLRSIIKMNIDRIMLKVASLARNQPRYVVPIYESAENPRLYNPQSGQASLPLISLTTIHHRLPRIHQTIKSLKEQTKAVHSINLYISNSPFLLDAGIEADDHLLKEVSDMGVNVYLVPNIGPYRKQYPIIWQLHDAQASMETAIITVDDDVYYPKEIIEILMSKLEMEESIIAHRGRKIAFSGGQIGPYKSFSMPDDGSSYMNMGTGKNGIAYRLRYFPSNIDEYIGPFLAPTADDLWCKWVTAAHCIPTHILEPRAAIDPSLDFTETHDDKNGLFHKYNAKGTNDDAIISLEMFFACRHKGIATMRGVN